MPDFQLRSFTPTQLPTLKLSIAYGILVLIIGGTYFFQPLLPLGVAFVVCLFAFRHWITFEMLFYIIIVMFLIVSPNVPPHEKHFRSPILLKGFLAQDIVLFAGLFLFAVGLVAQKIEFPKPKTFIEKAFLLFSISFVCSLAVGLWQGNRTEYVLSETRDFAYLMLFWLILVYASRFERVYVYFLVFIGSCAVFAVVSVIDAAVRYQFSRYNSGISFLLLAGFFFSLAALIIQTFVKRKVFFVGLLIVFLFAILFSFTRGLYLGMGVGLLVVMLCTGAAQTLRLVVVSAVALGAVVAVLLLFDLTSDFLVNQTINRGTEVAGGIDVSSAERILEVVAVLEAFPKHPIFGEGIGGTILVYRFTDLVGKAGMTDWWFIHNNYFQTLHKQGLVGLIALLALWIGAIWKTYTLYKVVTDAKKKVLLLTTIGTVVGFMTISMTSPVMTYSNTNFLNALLLAIIVIIEREENYGDKLEREDER
jgi:O-antigen ligase